MTDEMFFVAARVLADLVGDDDLELGRVHPPLSSIREVSSRIAVDVAEVVFARGSTAAPRPPDLPRVIADYMFDPRCRRGHPERSSS